MQKIIITITFIFIQATTFSQEKIVKTYSVEKLQQDFDLMINALKEAHPGLYWYNTIPQFDSVVLHEREQLKHNMDSYAFFRIASKIVAATKEGHCRIGSPKDVGKYFSQKALIPPILVKMLNGKLYLINNVENRQTNGQILNKINDEPIDSIINTIFSYSPKFADGHIKTGKIRYSIDYAGLAYNYTDYFENKPFYTLELLNPQTNQTTTIEVNAVSLRNFKDIENQIAYPRFESPIELYIDHQKSIAQLSLHSFRHTYHDKKGDETIAFEVFSSKIDSAFAVIKEANIQNLIIDVRNNGGGTEGYEDYVFSHLTGQPYVKYKYVQVNSLSFSFLNHTQYNTPQKRDAFERLMKDEFHQANDGRYLRKDNFMQVAPPKQNPFKGKIYVLISGRTYSGGSEFAGLLKAKTDAVFVGEETAGGFYGQTSGFGLNLTLPHTEIRISIPLLKFVTAFESDDIPFGRGVIPDYEIQPTYKEFVHRVDSELNLVLDLIANKKER
ncbi:S41 family peptidase [Olivibacter sp. XZL3]|uniref:S41 family peptidase n=1 Tax=Olivibacter sp. XZL3 TaxID=1735116 RepID=UPI001066E8BF|nr:S41 family peptidase [Olivibacter sp. XZL3]